MNRASPIKREPEGQSQERREQQRRQNVEIGEGSEAVPTAKLHSLDEMIGRFVLITDGSMVAPIDSPRDAMSLPDFRNAMAGSKIWIEADGKKRAFSAVNAWLEHPSRMQAATLTFRAGADRMTPAPECGRLALNTWSPLIRREAPADWKQRAQPFVDHIEWLWGQDADAFLDWLAHIEQRPGELPHHGWVHVSRTHGTGRNWASSVLARVWPGHVAASLDLVALLEGSFSGRMSRKKLAIVDEIHEGGTASHRNAQRLRQIVTEEHRLINPKYGRQRIEYNACRWLLFSNHTGALPLTEEDRRFWIVAHTQQPRSVDYYARLYALLADPLFIRSVAEWLAERNVAAFRPGARPPMNEAKLALIAVGKSETDLALKDLVDRWPSDVICAAEMNALLGDDALKAPGTRHAMDRAGITRLERKVRLRNAQPQRVYAIRNHSHWVAAPSSEIRVEIERFSPSIKDEALHGEKSA